MYNIVYNVFGTLPLKSCSQIRKTVLFGQKLSPVAHRCYDGHTSRIFVKSSYRSID
jgi:hypothetical protein